MSVNAALSLTSALVGLAVTISAVEDIVAARRIDPDALFDQALGQSRRSLVALADVCRLGAGVLLGVGAAVPDLLPIGAGIALSFYLVRLVMRPLGNDGADQLLVILLGGLTLAGPATGATRLLILCFITGELALIYWTSGLAKLGSCLWRRGQALPAAVSTRSFGSLHVAALMRSHHRLATAAAWSVIAVELFLPVVLMAPAPMPFVAVATGLLFHMTIAGVMGLNLFLWSFTAAYPSALAVSHAAWH
jgi:hypothetical protein